MCSESCKGEHIIMRSTSTGGDWESFSHNILWLRQTHQLSKTKMAKLLRISVKTLNRIEAGEMPKRLSVSVFFRIWVAFGVHPTKQLGTRLGEK